MGKLLTFGQSNIVRIISRKTLREFWLLFRDVEEPLKSWYKEVNEAEWNNSNELKKVFPSASIVVNNRIVFNIKGNHYRLVVRVNFELKIIWIRFIGTHKQYDQIDVKNM